MTTQEIYTQANSTTESQFSNLLNGLNESELKTQKSLVRLGDTKELALWTVIAQRYAVKSDGKMERIAYYS
jgi:hypothetical protein